MKKTLIAHAVMAQTAALVCVTREDHAPGHISTAKKDKPIDLLAASAAKTIEDTIAKAKTAAMLGIPTRQSPAALQINVVAKSMFRSDQQPRSGVRPAAVPV